MNAHEVQIFKAYMKLRQRLLRLENHKAIPVEKNEINSREDIFKNLSFKHHYIPKYFNDGFLDDDGLMFVYNKKTDRIKKNKQGSKGVFFEINRNSTDFGFEYPISLIEEAYTVLDNIFPIVIKLLRSDIDLPNDIRIELHAHLNTLVIDLFWRNINNDKLFEDIYNNASFTISDSLETIKLPKEEANVYKAIPFLKQLVRYKMAPLSLKAITKPENANSPFTANTITFPLKQLCIGDMPFVLKDTPKRSHELINIPAFIPLSSTKLYLRNISLKKSMGFNETNMLNALIIEQSSEMICSGNEMVLNAAIDYYRLARDEKEFEYYRNWLFNL